VPRVAELPAAPGGRTGWPWTEGTAVPECDPPAGGWPKITVVTISFQQAEFLEETIRSVLLQSYPNLEYIIVDGGSTDGSVDIIREYASHLAWWTSEPDRGPSHALNKGFSRATGAIHAYLNSDDVYEPGALLACAREFASGHEWVFGKVRYFRADIGYWPVPQLAGRRFTDWFVTCPISQPGSFWSARLAGAAGPFREELGFFFDYERWLRFRFREHVVPASIETPIAVYRLHEGSKTVSSTREFAKEGAAIRSEYRAYLGFGQRVWLWIVKRHRRARSRGARAVELLLAGRRLAAVKQLLLAFAIWPLLVVDRGILIGISQLARGNRRQYPEVWPEWDE